MQYVRQLLHDLDIIPASAPTDLGRITLKATRAADSTNAQVQASLHSLSLQKVARGLFEEQYESCYEVVPRGEWRQNGVKQVL